MSNGNSDNGCEVALKRQSTCVKKIFFIPSKNPFTIVPGLCRISAHSKKDTISCVISDTIYYMLFVLTFIYLFPARWAEPYRN